MPEDSIERITESVQYAIRGAVAAYTRIQISRIERVTSRLNFTLEAANLGLWEIDLLSNSFWQSEMTAKFYGRMNDVTRMNLDSIFGLIDPEDQPRDGARGGIKSSEKDFFNREFQVIWPDETVHWLSEHGRIYRDAQGRPIRIAAIVSEITEQKRIEKEREHLIALSQMDLKASRLEREMRETFISALTHDLRTPLTSAKMVVQMLFKASAKPESQEHMKQSILKSLERTEKMIQNLLDTNRLRAGQSLPIRVQKCDLSSTLLETIQELTITYGERFTLSADTSILGDWDCDELRRVIENLVLNAIKYGTLNTPITIKLSQFEGITEIRVHNVGPAISPEDIPTLFEPFHRLKRATESGRKGWGIGLTLVRGIVEAHQGNVWVESSFKDGTTFIVELPTRLPTRLKDSEIKDEQSA